MAPPLDRLLSIDDLRKAARRQLPKSIFDFIDGGAEDELTLRDNRAAFERRRVVRRVLTDVSAPDIATRILDTPAKAPIVVSPMGSCMLAWPEADIAIARAAHAHGIPYTLSTMSTTSIERMAKAADGPLWFQLYVLKNREFNRQLVERARQSGYTTLVVTVDLQAGGKREKDLRNGIRIPLRIGIKQVLEGVVRPGWSWRMARAGLPEFENARGLLSDGSAGLTIAARVGQNLDAAFDWHALAELRDQWPGQLVIKGVEHPDDAVKLVSMGADGIWVSNHGGRQLDGAVASADALPHVAAAVKDKVTVLIDSGVRRGVDILKARALGATAVGVGRAALFGCAVGGHDGAMRALQILVDELTLSMKLAGVPSLAGVDGSLLA